MRAISVRSIRGQTLLELVVSIGVVAFVVLGLVTAVTSSLRFGQASKSRSGAVKYAQEAMERARQLRDEVTWTTFLTYAGSPARVWCIDSEGVWTTLGGASCTALEGRYTRTISLTRADPIVQAVVTVSWQEGSQQFSTDLESYFSQWK